MREKVCGRTWLATAVAIVFSGCSAGTGAVGGGTATAPCRDANLFERWKEQAASRIAQEGVQGAAIALVCEGRLEQAAGVGVKKAGTTDPVDANTLFEWGSVTKQLTAAAALSLQADGAIDLGKPVTTWVPSVPWTGVTLEELLTHTAGFPSNFVTYPTLQASLADTVAANTSMALWAPPGALWDYSNAGYSLTGLALQNASGVAFPDLLAQRVFGPAGMATATQRPSEVVAHRNYAWGHSLWPGYSSAPLAPTDAYYGAGWLGPPGGTWGSVTDLGQWAVAQLQGMPTLSANGFQALRTERTRTDVYGEGYGLGMLTLDGVSPPLWFHEGEVVGFSASIWILPEQGLAFAVLMNADDAADPDLLINDGAALFAPPFTFAPLPPPGTAADFAGTYNDPINLGRLTVGVSATSGALTVAFPDGTSAPLSVGDGADSFFLQDPTVGATIDVNFWRPNEIGPAAYLISRYGIAARVP